MCAPVVYCTFFSHRNVASCVCRDPASQLLSQTDGIESASRLQRPTIRDRNAMAIQLAILASPGTAFIYGPSHLQIFSELLRRKLRGRSVISYFETHVAGRLGLRSLNYK